MIVVAHFSVPIGVAFVAWAVAGFGMGISYSPVSLVVLAEAPAGGEGTASASLQLCDVLGIALGTGVSGAIVAAGAALGWAESAALDARVRRVHRRRRHRGDGRGATPRARRPVASARMPTTRAHRFDLERSRCHRRRWGAGCARALRDRARRCTTRSTASRGRRSGRTSWARSCSRCSSRPSSNAIHRAGTGVRSLRSASSARSRRSRRSPPKPCCS